MLDTQSQAPAPNSYDEVPYDGLVFPQSHPDRLATIGRLFGMMPPPIDRCRVLELGCAMGFNLIPMAMELPHSQFVGYDLSARQVEEGMALIRSLGLTNIQLEHKGILDIKKEDGEFDYIIAHGVYSWVPEPVRNKILAICRENLARAGIGYVSYNTYPGWHMFGIIRDMMLYHTAQFSDPRIRIAKAREHLEFLARSVNTDAIGTVTGMSSAYGILLKDMLAYLPEVSDSYLYHEYLEPVNEPVYLHQFVERAACHGLQYVGDANLDTMLSTAFPREVQDALLEIAPDIVRREQYLDFLRHRSFRHSLLCHAEIRLDREIAPSLIPSFYIASSVRPVSKLPELDSDNEEEFRTADGQSAIVTEPLAKAALLVLSENWPRALSFEQLLKDAAARLRRDLASCDAVQPTTATELLSESLLHSYRLGLLELRQRSPACMHRVSERPLASPLARYHAARGSQTVSQRHKTVVLDDFSRQVIQLLNGTNARADLLGKLGDLVARGLLALETDNQASKDSVHSQSWLAELLDQSLSELARLALLIG